MVVLAVCKIETNQKKETRNLRSRAVHVRTELENHGATKYIAGVEDWHVFSTGPREGGLTRTLKISLGNM